MGPQLGNNLRQPRHRGRRRARRWPALGQDLDALLALRGGAGPGQRRPRPAGRLLPRFAGDARAPGDRLRHPLRVRHLRPGDPRRLAGRDHRQVAAPRQPVGDRQARHRLLRQLGRPHRALHATTRAATACAGCRDAGGQGHRLRHADPGLRRQHLQHAAAVERRGRRVVRLPGLQHRRLLRGGRARRSSPRPSPRCSTPTTSRRSASGCGSRSSTSSSPARCRTCCACSTWRASRSRDFARALRRAAQRHPSRRSPSPS